MLSAQYSPGANEAFQEVGVMVDRWVLGSEEYAIAMLSDTAIARSLF